jgi:hypothetical protein
LKAHTGHRLVSQMIVDISYCVKSVEPF